MSGKLKMKWARWAVGYAKDDNWLASDVPAIIFAQKYSLARNEMLFSSTHILLPLKYFFFQPTVQYF